MISKKRVDKKRGVKDLASGGEFYGFFRVDSLLIQTGEVGMRDNRRKCSLFFILTTIFMFMFLFTSCSKNDNLKPQSINIRHDVYLGYLRLIDSWNEEMVYVGWGVMFDGMGPFLLDNYIEGIEFDGERLLIFNFHEEGINDVWTSYAPLPPLAFGSTHHLYIKTTNSSVNVDVTIPYPITEINFPKEYDISQPFRMEWTVDDSNLQPLRIARFIEHERCGDNWPNSNCCEYSFSMTLAPEERSYTFDSIQPAESDTQNRVMLSLFSGESININDNIYINVGGIGSLKRVYYQ